MNTRTNKSGRQAATAVPLIEKDIVFYYYYNKYDKNTIENMKDEGNQNEIESNVSLIVNAANEVTETNLDALTKVVSVSSLRAIETAKNRLLHNKAASIALENLLSQRISSKSVQIDNASYIVTLYFVPISFMKLHISDLERNGYNYEISPVLSSETCLEIGEIFQKHLKPKTGEQIKIISGLISRDLINGELGSNFLNSVSDAVCKDEKSGNDLNYTTNELLRFNALPNILLSDSEPESHRALMFYTLTKKGSKLDLLIKNQEILRLNLTEESTQHFDMSFHSELNESIHKCYINTPKTHQAVLASCLPAQSAAFMNMTNFQSTLFSSVIIAQRKWGGVNLCKITSSRVGEHLSIFRLELQCVDDEGSFVLKQTYTPAFRYNFWNELKIHSSVISHISNICIDENHS